MSISKWTFLFLFLTGVSDVSLANSSCDSLLTPVDKNLLVLQKEDSRWHSPRETRKMNLSLIQQLDGIRPEKRISIDQAYEILELLKTSPVVCKTDERKYQDPENPMGFCFGRAVFVHMQLLKMGVEKKNILKAWAVGPHQSENLKEILWAYHVGVLIPVEGYGWMVIDTLSSYRIYSLETWYNSVLDRSTDKQLRLYLTSASKLGPMGGKYNRLDMGLDMDPEADHYKGYFQDLMRSMGRHKR